jgi:hypothetical protein
LFLCEEKRTRLFFAFDEEEYDNDGEGEESDGMKKWLVMIVRKNLPCDELL